MRFTNLIACFKNKLSSNFCQNNMQGIVLSLSNNDNAMVLCPV